MARATFKIDETDNNDSVIDLRATKLTMDNVKAFGRRGDFLGLDYNTFEINADGTVEYK